MFQFTSGVADGQTRDIVTEGGNLFPCKLDAGAFASSEVAGRWQSSEMCCGGSRASP
jgi:hypothetical protein